MWLRVGFSLNATIANIASSQLTNPTSFGVTPALHARLIFRSFCIPLKLNESLR